MLKVVVASSAELDRACGGEAVLPYAAYPWQLGLTAGRDEGRVALFDLCEAELVDGYVAERCRELPWQLVVGDAERGVEVESGTPVLTALTAGVLTRALGAEVASSYMGAVAARADAMDEDPYWLRPHGVSRVSRLVVGLEDEHGQAIDGSKALDGAIGAVGWSEGPWEHPGLAMPPEGERKLFEGGARGDVDGATMLVDGVAVVSVDWAFDPSDVEQPECWRIACSLRDGCGHGTRQALDDVLRRDCLDGDFGKVFSGEEDGWSSERRAVVPDDLGTDPAEVAWSLCKAMGLACRDVRALEHRQAGRDERVRMAEAAMDGAARWGVVIDQAVATADSYLQLWWHSGQGKGGASAREQLGYAVAKGRLEGYANALRGEPLDMMTAEALGRFLAPKADKAARAALSKMDADGGILAVADQGDVERVTEAVRSWTPGSAQVVGAARAAGRSVGGRGAAGTRKVVGGERL